MGSATSVLASFTSQRATPRDQQVRSWFSQLFKSDRARADDDAVSFFKPISFQLAFPTSLNPLKVKDRDNICGEYLSVTSPAAGASTRRVVVPYLTAIVLRFQAVRGTQVQEHDERFLLRVRSCFASGKTNSEGSVAAYFEVTFASFSSRAPKSPVGGRGFWNVKVDQ